MPNGSEPDLRPLELIAEVPTTTPTDRRRESWRNQAIAPAVVWGRRREVARQRAKRSKPAKPTADRE